MSDELITIDNDRNIVGECPLWDDEKKKLYHIDIRSRNLHVLDWETGKKKTLQLPQLIGSIALSLDGSLIGAMEDGIYYLDEQGGAVIAHKPVPISGLRFNDGKVGPDGRFYVGTIKREGGGQFYCLEKNEELRTLFGGIRVSNGLDWSVDNKLLYYCDTSLRRIDSFKFDVYSGVLSGREIVFQVPEQWGFPDGLTIDMEGNLWIALWNGGQVICLNPNTGRILDRIELPVSKVTSCTFAGDNMDELVITTASLDCVIANEPLAGNLFKMKLGVSGRKTFRFK